MSTIYIVINTQEHFNDSETITNERAFLTREKAEAFIDEYLERVRIHRRKRDLILRWKSREMGLVQPVKDNSIKKQIEALYKTKNTIPSLDVKSALVELKSLQAKIDEKHKIDMLEYERRRLIKKEEFSLSLSQEDAEIFNNDNIREVLERHYHIEELELVEE